LVNAKLKHRLSVINQASKYKLQSNLIVEFDTEVQEQNQVLILLKQEYDMWLRIISKVDIYFIFYGLGGGGGGVKKNNCINFFKNLKEKFSTKFKN
jgi:hypothetical protein